MKKIITSSMLGLGFLLLLITSVPSQAVADTAPFNVNLRVGLRNSAEVTRLQEFLVSQGFLKVQPTGNFLGLTLKAVRDFQTSQGILPQSGFFGPLTRAATNRILLATNAQPATIAIQSVTNSGNALGASAALSNSKTVTWLTTDYPANIGVNINLLRRGADASATYTLIRTIAADTANDGQENWIPQTGEDGADIYVEVTCSSAYQFIQGCNLSNTPLRVN